MADTSDEASPAVPPGSGGMRRAPASAPQIVLELGDVLPRIPASFLKPDAVDRRRKLRFPANDLFAGVAKGRVSVPLDQIARQCPDCFVERSAIPRDFEVHLPLQKVVQQVGPLPARPPGPEPPGGPPLVQEKKEQPHPAPPAVATGAGTPAVAPFLELNLAAILRGLPAATFQKPPPDSIRIRVDLSQIESQLATGSVSIPAADFAAALPAELRADFKRAGLAKVPIPLEEIFKNLGQEPAGETLKEPVPEAQPAPARPTPDAAGAEKNATPGAAPAAAQEASCQTAKERVANEAPQNPPVVSGEQPQQPAEPVQSAKVPVPQTATSAAVTGESARPAPSQPESASVSAEMIPEMPKAESVPAITLPAKSPVRIPLGIAKPPPPPLYASRTAVMPPPKPRPAPVQPPLSKPTAIPPANAAAAEPMTGNASYAGASLGEIFGTKERLDFDNALEWVATLDGVAGCCALFERDLKFAGTVPPRFAARSFRDAIWETLRTINNFAERSGMGTPAVVTLESGTLAASLFCSGDAALCVFHSRRELAGEVRDKLRAVTRELARML